MPKQTKPELRALQGLLLVGNTFLRDAGIAVVCTNREEIHDAACITSFCPCPLLWVGEAVVLYSQSYVKTFWFLLVEYRDLLVWFFFKE